MAKKKIGQHLQFYMDCIKSGYMPKDGLCINTNDCGGLLSQELLDILTPTTDDLLLLYKKEYSTAYWASGIRGDSDDQFDLFTPLRQTIVLFMAAINNEL